MVNRSSIISWRRSLVCLAAGLLLCHIDGSAANPTNPVFIQRDLPPAPPYAFGFQDADSSEEVTIVKRSGGRGDSVPITYLTTTQAEPVAVTGDDGGDDEQQEEQKTTKTKTTVATASTSAGPRAVKKDSAAPAKGTTSSSAPATPSGTTSADDRAPRPEDMPQRIKLNNNLFITRPQKRNVYDTYTGEGSETGHSCSCGGYMLVEKKIYACEPKETVVRLMKRSPNHDDCIAQETQHVGVVQMPDDGHEESFQLVPLEEDTV